jgi:hypothetical protein
MSTKISKSPKGSSCPENEVLVSERKATPEGLSRFKNASGAWLTKQLFIEYAQEDKSLSKFSLKGYDHEYRGMIYPSLRRLYVESMDPTEFIFAENHLGGWEHWKAICNQSWFKEYLSDWREELETKIRAHALLRIRQTASNSSKDALQANRLLLQGGWKLPDEKSSVGRPTKEKIKEEAQKMFKDQNEFSEDFNRIFQ